MPGELAITEVSLGQRVIARTLDGFIVGILTIPLRAVVPGRLGVLASVVVLLAYEGAMTRLFSATVGKLVMGTRIHNADGNSISGTRAALRLGIVALGTVIAMVLGVPIFAAGWVVIIGAPAMFGPTHRGVHDRITATAVSVELATK